MEHARRAGKVISYDPNWRQPLWENDDVTRSMMSRGLEMADVVKLSEAELGLLTSSSDLDWGTSELMDRRICLVVVTLGARGYCYRSRAGTGHLPTYKAKVVDITGASDAIVGGLLFQLAGLGGMETGLSSLGLQALSASELERMLAFANAAGALSTSKRGGAFHPCPVSERSRGVWVGERCCLRSMRGRLSLNNDTLVRFPPDSRRRALWLEPQVFAFQTANR